MFDKNLKKKKLLNEKCNEIFKIHFKLRLYSVCYSNVDNFKKKNFKP